MLEVVLGEVENVATCEVAAGVAEVVAYTLLQADSVAEKKELWLGDTLAEADADA
jgi:hypothetical protein